MRTVVLMAYRGDGEGYGGSGWRDRAFTFVYDYLTSFTDEIFTADSCHTPFNISKSYNLAAQAAGDWDTAVIHPPDVFAEWEVIERAVIQANRMGGIVHPFNYIRKLRTEEQQEAFFKGERIKATWKYRGDFPPIVLTRELWEDIGGYDEGLTGHGAEDSIIAHVGDVLSGVPRSRMPGRQYVLYHPKHNEDENHEDFEFYAHYDDNHGVWAQYGAITDPGEMRSFIAERRESWS